MMSPPANAAPASPTLLIAPTEPGAPFRPDPTRHRRAIDRVALIDRADQLEIAHARTIDAAARGILTAELARLDEAIDSVDLRPDLDDAVEPFGLGVAAFPVDEARKMFWDDWGQPRSGGRRHQGNDVLAQIGVPIRSIEDGVVEKVGSGGLAGLSITIVGNSGAKWFYAHLDEVETLEPGDRVLAGEQIGTNGDTGNARGAPHLHLQWAPDGETWENPYPVLVALWGDGAPIREEAFGPFNDRR